MLKIKVGQIYKQNDGEVFVISYISEARSVVSMIYTDGSIRFDFDNYCELIAEYPSWQEAVNSPEFKGE